MGGHVPLSTHGSTPMPHWPTRNAKQLVDMTVTAILLPSVLHETEQFELNTYTA